MNQPQLRSSQIITTFGPGSMVDLPEASIIVSGLDQWHYEADRIQAIDEPRLVAKLRRILNVSALTLRTPPPASELDRGFRPNIVGWRFPEWFIVQNNVITQQGFRRRRLVHLNSLDRDRFRDNDGKKYWIVPVRFVRACKKGHVGDIDWKAFVHGASTDCPRDLWMEERGPPVTWTRFGWSASVGWIV